AALVWDGCSPGSTPLAFAPTSNAIGPLAPARVLAPAPACGDAPGARRWGASSATRPPPRVGPSLPTPRRPVNCAWWPPGAAGLPSDGPNENGILAVSIRPTASILRHSQALT